MITKEKMFDLTTIEKVDNTHKDFDILLGKDISKINMYNRYDDLFSLIKNIGKQIKQMIWYCVVGVLFANIFNWQEMSLLCLFIAKIDFIIIAINEQISRKSIKYKLLSGICNVSLFILMYQKSGTITIYKSIENMVSLLF